MGPSRLIFVIWLIVVLVISACIPSETGEGDVPPWVPPAFGLPPGGLVASVPGFGRTEGDFRVSDGGEARYSLPLWVPDGHGKALPELSLSYSSQAGNGLLGVGWSLGGLPSITWCPRTMAQDGYTHGGDFFGLDGLCLDGNRLVPVSALGSENREYRTERATFSRIIAYGTEDGVPDYFRVWTKRGEVLEFGETADSRAVAYLLAGEGTDPRNPSLVQAAGAPQVTTAWALNLLRDRNDNIFNVKYTQIHGGADSLWSTQIHPLSIDYSPNQSVRFVYEPRPDPVEGFRAGTHSRIDVRLSRIQMWGGPGGEATQLLRQYRLGYTNHTITQRSLLRLVTETDRDGTAKAPLLFSYASGNYQFHARDAGSGGKPVGGRTAHHLMAGDVDGDGRTDLIHPAGTFDPLTWKPGYVIQRSVPSGFAPPVASGVPEKDTDELNPQAPRLVDVDADGRMDLVAPTRKFPDGPETYRWSLFKSDGSKFVFTSNPLGPDDSPISDLDSNARVYFADLDGNGLPDFISSTSPTDDKTSHWFFRLNSGETGASQFAKPVQTNERPNDDRPLPQNNFVLDRDGDGRAELLSKDPPPHRPGWYSWGLQKRSLFRERSTANLWGVPSKTHFGDLNGDGLQDAIYPYDSALPGGPVTLQVQLNSGNGFGPRLVASPSVGYAPPDAVGPLSDSGVRIADFNSDGRDDVMVFHDGTPTGPQDTAHGVQLYEWQDSRFVRAPLSQSIGSRSQHGGWNNTQVLDWDGDGALDLVNSTGSNLRLFHRVEAVPDRLTGIGNIHGHGRVEIGYTTLNNRGVHTPGICKYPQICPTGGRTIVSEHRVTTTAELNPRARPSWDSYNHFYTGARRDLHGRGWLGFAVHRVVRAATGASVITDFDNVHRDTEVRDYPFADVPKSITSTIRDFNDAQGRREFQIIVTNSHVLRKLAGNYGSSYYAELRKITTVDQERALGSPEWDSLYARSTDLEYHTSGNIARATSTVAGGNTRTVNIDYRNETIGGWLIVPTRKAETACTSTGQCNTRESTFDYDDRGNPTVTVLEPNHPALRLTTSTVYGEFGNVLSVTQTDSALRSRTEQLEYADADRLHPTAIINALGHRTTIQTDPGLGVPLSVKDPNGVTVTYRYDRFGRLRETNRSDGSFTRIGHKATTWQTATTTDSGGSATTILVDQLGRERESQIRTFDGRSATTYTKYDHLGRISEVSHPTMPGENPLNTLTEYDNRGRPTSVTAPDGAQVRYQYHNRETHTFDAKGVESYTVTNGDREIDARYEDDPDSANWLRTRFDYGPFGEITRIEAPDRTAQTMRYDVLGRQEALEDPSSGTLVSTYNAFGDVATLTDGGGNTRTYEHDALGRVTKETSSDGTATNTWDTAPNGIGLLATATSSDDIRTSYAYAHGRPTAAVWTIDGSSYEIGYNYERGRLAAITYPAAPVATERLKVAYQYNSYGYLSTVKDAQTGTAFWTVVERNGPGQVTKQRYGNGVQTETSFDPASQLMTAVKTTGADNVGALQELSYNYDANSNVTGQKDEVSGHHHTYDYDQLNRLKTWDVDGGQLHVTTAYSYDSVGNLKSERVSGQPDRDVTYTYGERGAPPHALTTRDGEQFSYDANGLQTNGPQRTVAYNRFNLPKVLTLSQDKRTEYRYDAGGVRTSSRGADDSCISVGGLFELRTDSTGKIHSQHNIVGDGSTIAQLDWVQSDSDDPNVEKNIAYFHTDRQGSTTRITNTEGQPSAAGPNLSSMLYDPFGQRINDHYQPLASAAHEGPRQGYTGHQHDDRAGLINMKGRIYDPQGRRFLTPDPYLQSSADATVQERLFLIGKDGTNGPDIDQLRKETTANINGAGDSHFKDPVFVQAAKDMHEAKLLAAGGLKGSERTPVEQRYERAQKELFARMESVGREIENRVTGNDSSRLKGQALKAESMSAADYGSAERQEAFAASLTTTGANETQVRGRAAAERCEGTHPSAAVTMGKGAAKAKKTSTGAAAGAERTKSGPAR